MVAIWRASDTAPVFVDYVGEDFGKHVRIMHTIEIPRSWFATAEGSSLELHLFTYKKRAEI